MSKYYKTKENVVFDTIVNLVMIFTLLVCFLPFVYMAALSLSSSKAIINNQVLFWPVGFNLDAYKQIFTYPNFFQAYGNTFIYTIGGTTIAMLMTIMFAYPLSKDNLMGHKFFMKIVVISMFFAGGMIPNYLLVSSLHLTGTRWAMLSTLSNLSRTSWRKLLLLTAWAIGAFCAASLCRFPPLPLQRSACIMRCSSGTTGSIL